MTKFIHADIAAKFAEVAQRREDPWMEFEFKHLITGTWCRCASPLLFDGETRYRHIPQLTETEVGENETTKYIHADILAKYAEVAQRRADPWVEFETRHMLRAIGTWFRCKGPIEFNQTFLYRHRPEPGCIVDVPRQFPEPMDKLPEDSWDVVYVADPTHEAWCYMVRADARSSPRHLDRRLAHATEENAIEAAKAMVLMVGGKVE